MNPKFYKVLEEAISVGIAYGVSRAHKHTDTPRREDLEIQIHNAVMNEISEWFDMEMNCD